MLGCRSLSCCAQWLDALPDPALVMDRGGSILAVNQRACEVFGYFSVELEGRPFETLLADRDWMSPDPARRAFYLLERDGWAGKSFELLCRRRDGSPCSMEVSFNLIPSNGSAGLLLVMRDLSELKEIKATLGRALEHERRMARHDPLTGAANRRSFFERLSHEVDCASAIGAEFALAFFDLDDFEALNGQLGHARADEVLSVVADCLKGQAGEGDLVARLGGDEFALILSPAARVEARERVQDIRVALLAAMLRGGWAVTFSIGAVVCAGVSVGADDLLNMAADLTRSVKREGRNAIKWRCLGKLVSVL